MVIQTDFSSTFTPEYSTELQERVQDIYQNDIKPLLPQLRLSKLIDLLEHTAYLLEAFHHFLPSGRYDDALSAYIVGCYYLYLIIPQSTQFQTKNKSYSMYNDWKILYQNEANMTNVCSMVRNEVDSILDKSYQEPEPTKRVIPRGRAFSVKDDTPKDYNTIEFPIRERKSSTTQRPLSMAKPYDSLPMELDDSTPLWTAPSLNPNDQLKLALEQPELTLDEQLSDKTQHNLIDDKYNNFTIPLPHQIPLPVKVTDFNHDKKIQKIYPVDRSETHRKDSYHSVYMDNDNSAGYVRKNDEANNYIQTLERLQKQNVITCPELFSILSDPTTKDDILLIYLGLPERTKSNYIVAKNTINIDPNVLWDFENNCPISEDTKLEKILNDQLFNIRKSFAYVVYYTDLKTYMKINFDYNFTLFYLLTSSRTSVLKTFPTSLLGGLEKWKKVIRTYYHENGINALNYLHKFHVHNIDQKEGDRSNIGVEHYFWNAPEIPMRIRQRPPPPIPSTIIHPPLPPKIGLIDSTLEGPNQNDTILASSKVDYSSSNNFIRTENYQVNLLPNGPTK
ncbi:hypothetical protein Kpol_304p6, partial [Vanderwaltozyma polyspora DSM 70294]